MLTVHSMVVGVASENTYAVVNEKREALIIDPGAQSERLIAWIEQNGWQPKAVLLTHCHFDHIGAVDALRDYFKIEAYVHQIEADFLSDAQLNLSIYGLPEALVQRPAEHIWSVSEIENQQVAGFEFKVAFIPGHSPGHVVYLFEADHFVIAGDTLFRRSIGRTDLPQGDLSTLLTGIRRHLLTLPEETVIYPGHGSSTMIGAELQANPYLQ